MEYLVGHQGTYHDSRERRDISSSSKNPGAAKIQLCTFVPATPLHSTPQLVKCSTAALQRWNFLPLGTDIHSTWSIHSLLCTSVCGHTWEMRHSLLYENSVIADRWDLWQKGKRVHLFVKCHGNRGGTLDIICFHECQVRDAFTFFDINQPKSTPCLLHYLLKTQELPFRTAERDDCDIQRILNMSSKLWIP